MEELIKQINIIDYKILTLSTKLNKAKKHLQSFNEESKSINYKEVFINADKLSYKIKKLEYDRIRLICLLSSKILNEKQNKFELECTHIFDIKEVSRAYETLCVLSKCLICGFNEVLHTTNIYDSYEEFIKDMNQNIFNFKYIGACKDIDEITSKPNIKVKKYVLSNSKNT